MELVVGSEISSASTGEGAGATVSVEELGRISGEGVGSGAEVDGVELVGVEVIGEEGVGTWTG